ncbi:hypothetical protein D3C72_2046540 [compost metagenome]
MAWDTFVYDNIKKELLKEGFPLAVAHNGAEYGADHYRRMSQASRKGGLLMIVWFVLADTYCPDARRKRNRQRLPERRRAEQLQLLVRRCFESLTTRG